jgi:hypothetical protein
MESVEGMLKGLRLSEEELKGIRIGGKDGDLIKGVEAQAVGKLFSEKPAFTDALANALGPIWCPMKGIDVKDLGGNIFLFTFHQPLGKKKAVENGPWIFDNDLLVMEEFVASKTLDDYAFDRIPIWVRVHKLPLGRMSADTGEQIGNQIGEFIEVADLVNGMAVGQYLRVKVWMRITKPLMRGTMVDVEEGKGKKWCPFEYEYLPDFCYHRPRG